MSTKPPGPPSGPPRPSDPPPVADVLAAALRLARARRSEIPTATSGPPTPTPSPLPTPAPAPGARPLILVVDDDPFTRRAVSAMLREVGDVIEADDGATALAMIAVQTPSVVVTDVMMPNVDGLELARRLKHDPHTARIPIVMLTVRAAPDDTIAGVNAGARFYVTKPVDTATLRARVKRALAG